MLGLIATILVLAFLVYKVWPWFWHIVTSLFLALLVYIAWPWFLQKPWEDLMSRLQQIHLPQQIASATNTPSGRLYVSPERTDETRIHFEELGQAVYPRPYPRPFLCAKDWAGKMFSFGKEGAGICLTTKSRTDTSVFRRKNLSGVGRYRQMLLRCHARVPIPVRMGGVGEMRSGIAMIADRQFYMIDCSGA